MEKSPNNFYSCNLGGGLKESGLDQWKLTREALWYTADNQSRSAVVAPVWQDAQQVKFAHALMGDRPVAAVSASYARSRKDHAGATSPIPLLSLYAAWRRHRRQEASSGITGSASSKDFKEDRRWQNPRPRISQLAGPPRQALSQPDDRWLKCRHRCRTPICHSLQRTHRQKTRRIPSKVCIAVLTEARIPFDFVHEEDLTRRAAATDTTVLILPNVAFLSDPQCRALESYVERGGSLLATFETSLYDETGKPRADFALGKLFGISKTRPARAIGNQDDRSLSRRSICNRSSSAMHSPPALKTPNGSQAQSGAFLCAPIAKSDHDYH